MKKIVTIFLLTTLLSGCLKKDDLTLNNPNTITTAVFWKTEADVLEAMGAAYNLLRNKDHGYWGYKGTQLTNARGDDFFSRNDDQGIYSASIFTNTADNNRVDAIWNNLYQIIFRTNQIIENTPRVNMDDTRRKELVAEAKFLRGLSYFNLCANFGDVPIHLTVPMNKEQYYIEKSPEVNVYEQIVKDFSEAAADLPVSYPSEWVGRATKGAAYGYLGKAYLYQHKYHEAAQAFEIIMAQPFNYDLMENFGDNFTSEYENNKESVFEIQLKDIGGSSWATGVNENLGTSTAQGFAPTQVGGWFQIYPNNKLFNAFQKERTTTGELDPRMIATLVWEGQAGTFYQRPIADFFPTEFGFSARIKKYQNFNATSELTGVVHSQSSSINERALRFADVLLMYAEALTMQDYPELAYDPVNRIRRRADLTDLPPGYDAEQMMAEIRHQRMIEFAREGLRFYDLKRWGLLEQELAKADRPEQLFFDAQKLQYFPIPQAELNANPKMVQRSGW